jgi:branched-chain amino acid transport system permease protein
MSDDVSFFFLLISNGLLTGLMYSLIALGFVLVYKATDAINFAQGEFVMIAGFVAAGSLMVWGAPLWGGGGRGGGGRGGGCFSCSSG